MTKKMNDEEKAARKRERDAIARSAKDRGADGMTASERAMTKAKDAQTAKAKEEEPTPAKALQISARYMTGDLIKVVMREIEQQQVPWGALPEAQQAKVIERVTKATQNAVRYVCDIIASMARPSVTCDIESVTFKDGIKVTLTMSKQQADRHAIADAQGQSALLVIPSHEVAERGDAPKPTPDQPALPLEGKGDAEA